MGPHVGAAYSPAQLIEVCQSERVGSFDDNGVCPWYVETRFDNAGAHQHIALPRDEIEHHLFQIPISHLPVCHGHPSFGHEVLERGGSSVNRLNAVVEEKGLTATANFTQQSLSDYFVLLFHHVGSDGLPIRGRCLDDRQIPNTRER